MTAQQRGVARSQDQKVGKFSKIPGEPPLSMHTACAY
jgi:hypothetical protein